MSIGVILGRVNASPKMAVGATVGAMILLVAAAGFLVVSPKNSHAGKLDGKIAETQARLGVQRSQAAGSARIDPRSVAGLSRAMPDRPQVSRLVRELNGLAHSAGVTLDTITPQAPTGGSGYEAIPLTVVVDGDFLAVRRFMRDLRLQVRIEGHNVRASGRLYDVQSVDFEQSSDPRPNVRATLTMQAFAFAPTLAASKTTTAIPSSVTTAAAGK
jgi:Tfp pilus assembly protein PilO